MYGYGYGNYQRNNRQQNPYYARSSAYSRRSDDHYRLREQDYGYIICRYCSNHHRNDAQKCYIMCQYCHGIHFKKDLKLKNNNFNAQVCPLMLVNTIQHQTNKAFDCQQCGGHGTYEKYMVTTYRQPLTSFKRRQQYYQELKRQFGEQGLEIPQHRIYNTKESVEIQSCQVCKGKGKIFRVTECCENGCADCKYARIRINPKWRQIRLQGELNKEEVFPCRVCNEQVDLSQKILKLNCGHAFHHNCILKQLAFNNHNCYICKEEDPFLDAEDFKGYVIEEQMIQKLLKQLTVQKESTATKELNERNRSTVPLNDNLLMPYQSDVSIDMSSNWGTNNQSENSIRLQGLFQHNDSLNIYVNTLREQNKRLLLQQTPEENNRRGDTSEQDTPSCRLIRAENDLSIKVRTNEQNMSDIGSFSQSSIKLDSPNQSLIESNQNNETKSVKSQGDIKGKAERSEIEQ